jgi:hypothetical protein
LTTALPGVNQSALSHDPSEFISSAENPVTFEIISNGTPFFICPSDAQCAPLQFYIGKNYFITTSYDNEAAPHV